MTWLDDLAADIAGQKRGLFHYQDPLTSEEAASRVNTGTQRVAVLLAFAQAGEQGLTQDELAVAVGHPQPHVAGTRRGELEAKGLIERTKERRLSAQGNPAGVYRISPLGSQVSEKFKALA